MTQQVIKGPIANEELAALLLDCRHKKRDLRLEIE